MVRLALCGGVVVLTFTAVALSAQGHAECDRLYIDFLNKLMREERSKMSGERLVALTRKAQRIYDACRTGHLDDPKTLFEGLDRSRG